MRVLGVNAIFHDPSAALVVGGRIVAAAEEERVSRRKHGKRPVPWSAWDLGFLRSSDEYKVMALASYGKPRHLDDFRELVRTTGDGGFVTDPVDWDAYAPKVRSGDPLGDAHADLACSAQQRLEEVLLELTRWLHVRSGARRLTMAGGTALNCVANSVLARQGPCDEIWVQPAAGDAGTSLGAALHLSANTGRTPVPMEYGPRALGHRSLLAHPGDRRNLERLNDIKGREQFRPVAPLVLADRAAEIFDGPLPSPYMLFVHDVVTGWRERMPAVVQVDGTARIQTVDRDLEPLLTRLLHEFDRRTGLPVLVNTSLNTAGRPMVDGPSDALELFGSTPADLLVLGPHLVRRAESFQ